MEIVYRLAANLDIVEPSSLANPAFDAGLHNKSSGRTHADQDPERNKNKVINAGP